MSVKVEFIFDEVYEAKDFFERLSLGASKAIQASTPSVVPTAAAPAVIPMSLVSGTTAQSSLSPAPVGSAAPSADALAVARDAMTNMMSRFPAGQGAIKTREMLNKHGLKRIGEATPDQLAKLTAEFNATHPVAA